MCEQLAQDSHSERNFFRNIFQENLQLWAEISITTLYKNMPLKTTMYEIIRKMLGLGRGMYSTECPSSYCYYYCHCCCCCVRHRVSRHKFHLDTRTESDGSAEPRTRSRSAVVVRHSCSQCSRLCGAASHLCQTGFTEESMMLWYAARRWQ